MGGSFGATKSLFPLFGAERVRDTPISEAGFVGAGVGAAAAGLRPVVDVMWADFTAARVRPDLQPGGEDVVHVRRAGAAAADDSRRDGLRSQRRGAALRHAVLDLHAPARDSRWSCPSTPYDAKGLLLEAIFDDGPVLFFEHLKLYVAQGAVPEEPYRDPARRRRGSPHRQPTSRSSPSRRWCRGRSRRLSCSPPTAISAEVIDPRTLSPLDEATIIGSVEKTGALVVVDESPPRCSIASDIAATVSEKAFDHLNGPGPACDGARTRRCRSRRRSRTRTRRRCSRSSTPSSRSPDEQRSFPRKL